MATPTALTPGNVTVLTNVAERTDSDGTEILPRVTVGDRYGQRMAPVAQLAVAPTSPPANLNAGSDTTVSFPNTDAGMWNLRRVYIENNSDGGTPVTVYVNFDAAASPGTCKVRPGEWRSYDVPVNAAVHLYCASALSLNGGTDGGIVLLGWL